jgi:hypothetical protein
MATQSTTFVIDPEFAFCGPMAFDVGKALGNLLLAFFAADGLASGAGAVLCYAVLCPAPCLDLPSRPQLPALTHWCLGLGLGYGPGA